MGPPPPPPPPPLFLSSTALPSSRWKTAQAPRRDNNSLPATSNTTRPTVDSAALQHAAARLRKTGYYEQIRGDVTNLPDGRVAGTDQRLSDGDRSYGAQLNQLGSNSSGKQIHAAPTHTHHADSLGDIRGSAHSGLKVQNTGMPSMPTTFSGMPRNIREPSNNPLSESFIENSKTKPDVYASQNFQSYTSPSQKYRNLSPAHAYVPFHSDILPQDFRQSATYQERQYSPRSYSTQRSPQSCTFGGQTYTTEIGQLLQPTTADPSTVSLDWEAYHTPSSSPILNPRALIHEFATQNYVEPDPPRGYDYVGITGREMRNNTSPHDLATVIRNQSLTPTQREANLYQTSTIRYDRTPFDGHKIYEQSYRGDEVDRLMSDMQTEMHVTRTTRTSNTSRSNICVACQSQITVDNPGCTALNQVFHVDCFKCKTCGCKLAGTSFYNIDNAPTCDACYQNSLEKCNKCNKPICDRLLRACGGAFHVECFVCTGCRGTLDGIPFTTDANKDVFCVPCYQDKFAPRCAVCHKGIVPVEGEKESVRVVAMDKSFHPSCYRCEDCGLQLSSKVEGAGCYPLNSHLYCKTCNSNRLRMQATV